MILGLRKLVISMKMRPERHTGTVYRYMLSAMIQDRFRCEFPHRSKTLFKLSEQTIISIQKGNYELTLNSKAAENINSIALTSEKNKGIEKAKATKLLIVDSVSKQKSLNAKTRQK